MFAPSFRSHPFEVYDKIKYLYALLHCEFHILSTSSPVGHKYTLCKCFNKHQCLNFQCFLKVTSKKKNVLNFFDAIPITFLFSSFPFPFCPYFLLHFTFCHLFSLALFSLISRQKFPGRKSLGDNVPSAPPPTACYTTALNISFAYLQTQVLIEQQGKYALMSLQISNYFTVRNNPAAEVHM